VTNDNRRQRQKERERGKREINKMEMKRKAKGTTSKPLPGVLSNVAMKAYPNVYFENLGNTISKFKLGTPQCP